MLLLDSTLVLCSTDILGPQRHRCKVGRISMIVQSIIGGRGADVLMRPNRFTAKGMNAVALWQNLTLKCMALDQSGSPEP